VAALLFHTSSVAAMSADGQFVVQGEGGNISCAMINRRMSMEVYAQAINWGAGYLTAMNETQRDTYSLNAGRSWTDWFDAFCLQNPHSRVVDAMQALVLAFWPQRQIAAPVTVLPPTPQPAARTVPARIPQRGRQW
jgi:hypothetical protein